MIGDPDKLRCQDKFDYVLNVAWKIPTNFVVGMSSTYKSCLARFESHSLAYTKLRENIT